MVFAGVVLDDVVEISRSSFLEEPRRGAGVVRAVVLSNGGRPSFS
jgi:hypothetical protein